MSKKSVDVQKSVLDVESRDDVENVGEKSVVDRESVGRCWEDGEGWIRGER